MHNVVILIGGNKGDILSTFQMCINEIEKKGYIIKDKSAVYKSKSWGYESENIFYNCAFVLETSNNSQVVLNDMLNIETKLGRTRSATSKYEDRVIDIDIMFYNSEIVNEANLIIPHPKLHLRNFCLVPLKEIIPDFVHPVLKKSIQVLSLESIDSDSVAVL